MLQERGNVILVYSQILSKAEAEARVRTSGFKSKNELLKLRAHIQEIQFTPGKREEYQNLRGFYSRWKTAMELTLQAEQTAYNDDYALAEQTYAQAHKMISKLIEDIEATYDEQKRPNAGLPEKIREGPINLREARDDLKKSMAKMKY
eukprot:SAG11_NODE_12464_length_702_cov_0.567164_2_plen_147_part_01